MAAGCCGISGTVGGALAVALGGDGFGVVGAGDARRELDGEIW